MRPTRIPVLAAALAALVFTSGCSGDGDGTTASAPTRAAQLFPSDFEGVCSGATVSAATAHDKSAAAHKVLYFESAAESGLVDRTSSLPKDWTVTYSQTSDSFKKIDLVACAKRTADKQVKICDGYESDGKATSNKVRWHTATYEVTVHAATTGKELAKETVEATSTVCPMLVSFSGNGETKDQYASVSEEDVIDLLKPFVQP